VPQTNETISAASRPKFTILWRHVEEILVLNKFFPIVVRALVERKKEITAHCDFLSFCPIQMHLLTYLLTYLCE